MTFLVILKRFEVWLLLAIIVALVSIAFRSEPMSEEAGLPEEGSLATHGAPDQPTQNGPAAPNEVARSLSLDVVRVDSTGGGWIVETTLTGKSPTGADLILEPPSVTAANDRGEPVARFFEPFRETATLGGSEETQAILRWWLPRPAASLRLEVAGESLSADLP